MRITHRIELGSAWAMAEEPLRACLHVQEMGGDPTAITFGRGEPLAGGSPLADVRDGVAIIRIRGPLYPFSYERIGRDLDAAVTSPEVKSIVLGIDSPGGTVAGASELADRIFAARSQKPVVAAVEGQAASGAYWLAAAAGEITTSDTGLLGSIGVVTSILDFRKMDEKIGLKEWEIVSSQSPNKRPDPASPSGRAQFQRIVDDLADVFIAKVARFRGLTTQQVVTNWEGGAQMVGAHAVEVGLADRIAPIEDVIAELAGSAGPAPQLPPLGGENPAPANQEDASMDLSALTIAMLLAGRRDLVETLIRFGVALENERAEAIRGLEIEGHGELIAQMVADPTISVAEAALKLAAAQKARRKASLDASKAAEDALDPAPGPGGDPEGPQSEEAKGAASVEFARKYGIVR